ncbi:hypothetical protein BJ138DRAFT_1141228 [Hygrophoropsis aurantiaca]|uniref:Uncharacterized protein n=1 Tax=Hygrophoropsis aurantiaca TaxID=72124 RepID=A0ACB8ATD6_9AGAM|nr:hypothetical protein BJ138DRAFT_1141228 [Hygrophoropsis aurantiaca]
MVGLKLATYLILTFATSFATAVCTYSHPKLGWSLGIYKETECRSHSKSNDFTDHHIFFGNDLKAAFRTSRCACFDFHALGGHVKSWVFTSGDIWNASLSLHTDRKCLGGQYRFTPKNAHEDVVDTSKGPLHSAHICVKDVPGGFRVSWKKVIEEGKVAFDAGEEIGGKVIKFLKPGTGGVGGELEGAEAGIEGIGLGDLAWGTVAAIAL